MVHCKNGHHYGSPRLDNWFKMLRFSGRLQLSHKVKKRQWDWLCLAQVVFHNAAYRCRVCTCSNVYFYFIFLLSSSWPIPTVSTYSRCCGTTSFRAGESTTPSWRYSSVSASSWPCRFSPSSTSSTLGAPSVDFCAHHSSNSSTTAPPSPSSSSYSSSLRPTVNPWTPWRKGRRLGDPIQTPSSFSLPGGSLVSSLEGIGFKKRRENNDCAQLGFSKRSDFSFPHLAFISSGAEGFTD